MKLNTESSVAAGNPEPASSSSPRDPCVGNVVGNFADSAARPTCNAQPTGSSEHPEPIVNLQSEIEHSAHLNHRHTGAFSRLPKDTRDHASQMLVDGKTYKQVQSWLASQDHNLSINSISTWKLNGGVDEYIREQDRVYDCRKRHELLERVCTDDTTLSNYQASPKMAVALIAEALIDLGPEVLRQSMKDDSRNAYRLLNSMARILSGGLRCEQHILLAAEHKARTEDATSTNGKGLSTEAQTELIDKLNLL
jgi:hypothetical protein